jgi:hypothetical protein
MVCPPVFAGGQDYQKMHKSIYGVTIGKFGVRGSIRPTSAS